MKVRIIEVEGEPHELKEFKPLLELFQPSRSTESSGIAESNGVPVYDTYDGELRSFIEARAGSPQRAERAMRFVTELLSWGTTEYLFGRSKASPDGLNNYLRLYNKGTKHFGAFAYLHPANGRVEFRLLRTEAKGVSQATVKDQNGGGPYEVILTLKSDEDHPAAVELAKRALAGVQRP